MSNLHAQQIPSPSSLAISAEIVVMTSAPLNVVNPAGTGVMIRGMINITTGTGATAVQIRVRQGTTLGGAQVGPTMQHTVGAGAQASIPYEVIDPTTQVQGQQWIVTLAQVNASTNGNINHATITTETATSAD